MARCLVNVNVGYYRWVCFNKAIHQSRLMKKENIQSEIASCDTESAFKTQFKISAVFRLPII